MAKIVIIFVLILTTIDSQLIPILSAVTIQHQSSSAVSRQQRGIASDSIELSHFLSSVVIRIGPKNQCSALNGEKIAGTPKHECQFLCVGTRVKYCWQTVRYPWVQDENGTVFGRRAKCARPLVNTKNHTFCNCVYTGSKFRDTKVVKSFSLRNQESDVDKNKVLTGVKFRLHNAMIHLEMKQSEFFSNGSVSADASWKNLGDIVAKSSSGHNPSRWRGLRVGRDYFSLTYEHRSMFLDEIYVPLGYVVTGVRFAPIFPSNNNPGIKLQIRGTEFDPSTYKLKPDSHQWFDHNNGAGDNPSYKRLREEMDLENCDVPSDSDQNVESETNKCFQFEATDVKKDLADHVIPFLSTKLAEPVGNIPVQGIGIAYTGAEGSGGFITLKVLKPHCQ